MINLKVKFEKSAAFRVYDELPGLITKDKEGNLYANINIPNDYNLYNYIFSFGDKAEVIEPQEIRARIKDKIIKILDKYKT